MWNTSTHHDISKPEILHSVLSDSRLFSSSEVDAILAGANDKKYKDLLLAETEKVLSLGAFGSPWFWVTNGEGKEEPFFGSDRLVSSYLSYCMYLGFFSYACSSVLSRLFSVLSIRWSLD